MTAATVVLKAGAAQGLIELRQSFAGAALIGQLFWPGVTLASIVVLRHVSAGPRARLGLGTLVLPGALGMFIAWGMLLVVQYLAQDREDGTLLRARATPHGIRGYLVGKLVTVSATILIYLVIIAVPGMFLISGVSPGGISWPTLAWVLALGLVATEPIGAILGSLVRTARGVGYVSLPVLGLTAISGIFYPVTVFPAWLRWIAEVFPVYWLGLGMRSAFLPASAAALEVGGSWRHLDTALVLGGWAVAGLLIAPLVLRRMARRASGSRLAVGTRR